MLSRIFQSLLVAGLLTGPLCRSQLSRPAPVDPRKPGFRIDTEIARDSLIRAITHLLNFHAHGIVILEDCSGLHQVNENDWRAAL